MPQYLHYLRRQIGNAQTQRLADLFLAAQRVCRPYDSLFESRERLPAGEDWSDILEQAYTLLTDPAVWHGWRKSCEFERGHLAVLGTNAVLFPLLTLRGQLNCKWPAVDARTAAVSRCQFTERADFAFRQPRLAGAATNEALRYQVERQHMAEIIGLPEGCSVQTAMDRDLVKPIKETRISRDALFNLDELANSFEPRPMAGASARRLRWGQYAHLLPLFDVDAIDLARWIQDGRLTGFMDSQAATLLEGFEPTLSSLYKNLVRSLRAKAANRYTPEQWRVLFGIYKGDLVDLVEAMKPDLDVDNLFTGKGMIEVEKRFVALPRFCKMHLVRLPQARKALQANGISPVVGRNFYKRNPETLKALRKCRKS
ncbi:hypothetical protein ACXYTJ_00015 [Gilvimarinus sp. F26214L]|uniref:hypothetical protein n=1 Tax=Gilvimarinus sp. DZF01 TaxID=3461371 RepID=UPI00404584C3